MPEGRPILGRGLGSGPMLKKYCGCSLAFGFPPWLWRVPGTLLACASFELAMF